MNHYGAKILTKLIATIQRAAFCATNPLATLLDPTKIFLKWTTPEQKSAKYRLDALLGSTPGSASESTLPKQPAAQTPDSLAVIVPFRDQWAMTARCLQALAQQKLPSQLDRYSDRLSDSQSDRHSTESAHHVILIDNDSQDADTLSGLGSVGEIIRDPWTVSIQEYRAPFNFSRMNNLAVSRLPESVEWLLFLNNDVEMTDPESLDKLLCFARTADTGGFPLGAVGCTLLYPDRSIQHLFAAPGVKIAAAHPGRGTRWHDDLAWNSGPQPVAAVTGAALLIKRATFESAGGFDENLPTAAQDIDLCLKLQKAGLINIALPTVVAIHHESLSRRGGRIPRAEISHFYEKWGDFAYENPFYSQNFSRWHEQPALRLGLTARFPWEKALK